MNNDDEDIDYVPYETTESGSFWDHLNPQRISVPRYQAASRIVVWIIFLFGECLIFFVYYTDGSLLTGCLEVSQALYYSGCEQGWLMSSPLETDGGIDPERRFDEWEYVLYIMTLAFLIEGKSSLRSQVYC